MSKNIVFAQFLNLLENNFLVTVEKFNQYWHQFSFTFNMGDVRNNFAFKMSVQVVLLAQNQESRRTIAYHFGMNQSTVSKVLWRHRETGRHTRRRKQGRKRITTPHQDQYLWLISIREGFLTAFRLQDRMLDNMHSAWVKILLKND
jgi:hypothetical protein